MKTGLGKLGLTPSAFWAMSWREFALMCEGFADFHTPKNGKAKAPTRKEAEEIITRADELLRKQGKL